MDDDTIVAIATPPGQGGVGVIRISGSKSLGVAHALFPGVRALPDRRVTYGAVFNAGGTKLDEGLVTYMRAPRTYTGEDVVEVSCHGSPLILDRIVAAALERGCRAARPGEFTLRAYLAGRIDLAQAEAIPDLVHAQSDAGLSLALRQLEGDLTRRIDPLRERLLDVLAHATAIVDFSEDDIPPLAPQTFALELETVCQLVGALLDGARQGSVLAHGVSLAIVGSPNVGKSSILNGLLRRERAIVTPVEGTTRDTLEEPLSLSGVLFRAIDTAGISRSNDPVERLGVDRSRVAAADADMVLLVLDSSRGLEDRDRMVIEEVRRFARCARLLVALNKDDLPCRLSAAEIPQGLNPVGVVTTSTVRPDGLANLEATLPAIALGGPSSDGFVVSNERHVQALRTARDGLRQALEALAAGMPLDLITLDVRAAARALGSITGADVEDDLLERVFSRFCIGK